MPPTLDRRQLLKLAGAGAATLAIPPALANAAAELAARPRTKAKDGAPNIIFVMTDDQAKPALSIYGNTLLKTPHMDRIGAEGLRFDEAFVTTSVCAPSRASYLTGLYAHSHGVTSNGEEPGWYHQMGLRHDQVTWPMLLRDAGWHTGIVGKWHIKSDPTGFDHAAILRGQGRYFDPEFIVNGAPVTFRGHTDDVIGDQALAFLQQRPKDRPFALCFHFKAPHGNWEADGRFADRFADAEIPVPLRFLEGAPDGAPEALSRATMDIAKMGDFGRDGQRRKAEVPKGLPPREHALANLQAFMRNYYRVLLGVDDNLGRVLDFLDANGLADNTIVVYTSDNGFFLGQFGFYDKRLMYEPSIRVPMLMRWPAGLAAGAVDDRHMVLNVDVGPTLLDMAGVAVPSWMQGRSWKPLLAGHAPRGAATTPRADDAAWRGDFLYEWYEYPAVHCVRKHRGVRTERWKLIHFFEGDEEWALYDLASDPDELVNLVDRPEHAARVASLRARIDALRRETGDDAPIETHSAKGKTNPCPA